jgi:hypothetical protein
MLYLMIGRLWLNTGPARAGPQTKLVEARMATSEGALLACTPCHPGDLDPEAKRLTPARMHFSCIEATPLDEIVQRHIAFKELLPIRTAQAAPEIAGWGAWSRRLPVVLPYIRCAIRVRDRVSGVRPLYDLRAHQERAVIEPAPAEAADGATTLRPPPLSSIRDS